MGRRPANNPVGSQISTKFIEALQSDFEQNGEQAIARVRAENPAAYAKLVADLTPKQAPPSAASEFEGKSIRELWEYLIDAFAEHDPEDFGVFVKEVKKAAKSRAKATAPDPNPHNVKAREASLKQVPWRTKPHDNG